MDRMRIGRTGCNVIKFCRAWPNNSYRATALAVLTLRCLTASNGYQRSIVLMPERHEDGLMQSEWLAMEKYRLDCVEEWGEGRRKQATRAAILSTIASLTRTGQAVPENGRDAQAKAPQSAVPFHLLNHVG